MALCDGARKDGCCCLYPCILMCCVGDRARAQGAFGDGKEDAGKILHAKMWHTLVTVPQFTLSLVNGSVMGYGLGVLAVSDMVLSVRDAYYNVSDAKMGSVNPTIKIGRAHV